jgi:hypothetical protein
MPSFQDLSFSLSETLMGVYLQDDSNRLGGRDLEGTWTDVNIYDLCHDGLTATTVIRSHVHQNAPKHVCHLLPSGKIVYFFQDGWVILWDKESGMRRVKYLPDLYQWSLSAGCTAVMEIGTAIRIAVHSLLAGLLWFDIELKHISHCRYVPLDPY